MCLVSGMPCKAAPWHLQQWNANSSIMNSLFRIGPLVLVSTQLELSYDGIWSSTRWWMGGKVLKPLHLDYFNNPLKGWNHFKVLEQLHLNSVNKAYLFSPLNPLTSRASASEVGPVTTGLSSDGAEYLVNHCDPFAECFADKVHPFNFNHAVSVNKTRLCALLHMEYLFKKWRKEMEYPLSASF